MTSLECPTCGDRFDLSLSVAVPFCSHRCRQIDLGRWLDEKQTLPVFKDPDEDPPEDPPSWDETDG